MLKVKPFRQKTGLCGPATIKMVLSYYGVEKTEAELAELMRADPAVGVDASRMIEASESLGFKGYFQDNSTFEDLERLVKTDQIPVIVDWFSEDDGHYSVVVDLDTENIYLLDPEIGHVRAMRRSKFFRIWFDFPGEYIKSSADLTIRRLIVILNQYGH
ncbi:MAG: hypothetical protein UX38_C0002G0111 [Microgenomates group bacterium GW2011_GWC1_46_16]|uniref:Peptidase C39 domain-containing protein n=2 Tax=Candidatus Collieribacteriota TaxID=1752725 RepID=A0A1F5G0G3_9BACT|nr:MAG: hypothetical protein UX32_C0001G0010 [Microgenomates group bacterium GW2011_GWF1_46_12]KKU26931.1 MAG: hypothetical protein UX38_C0002G0111 [Microgenomates group bacterium GW2011_GWC1_46_16]KKU28348.1 MAG: hypothetical protein UX40_C0001G0111 [Microgenomates group bacterium GW2011_GWF2_46_18]KKU43698.1 MAG: hypothetical protein UX59_C0011G0006 [Microgenomates group bacterium GW2011_GWA1_46_7]KKU45191.1 MAG: hypothetical protein UX63_C0010G0020 [Microgenomates group bacterium GW2011_GWB1